MSAELTVFVFLAAGLFVPVASLFALGRDVTLKMCLGLLAISVVCAVVFLALSSQGTRVGGLSFATMFLSSLAFTGVMAGWIVGLCVVRLRDSQRTRS